MKLKTPQFGSKGVDTSYNIVYKVNRCAAGIGHLFRPKHMWVGWKNYHEIYDKVNKIT